MMMFVIGAIFGAVVATLFLAYIIGRDEKAKKANPPQTNVIHCGTLNGEDNPEMALFRQIQAGEA
jgi:hypothetical protein